MILKRNHANLSRQSFLLITGIRKFWKLEKYYPHHITKYIAKTQYFEHFYCKQTIDSFIAHSEKNQMLLDTFQTEKAKRTVMRERSHRNGNIFTLSPTFIERKPCLRLCRS